MENDDNLLVRKIVKGNTHSFKQIVEKHQSKIFYLGLKFFHNPEEAEDFTQDVFLRAYEKLATFRGKVAFGAWLYRIAYNLAVNRYHFNRRRLPELPLEEHGLEVEIEDREADPEVKLSDDEFRKMVTIILAEMPDLYNIILKMHYFDGLKLAEIAGILDIPLNTVKSHVFRAKKVLKKKMTAFVEAQ